MTAGAEWASFDALFVAAQLRRHVSGCSIGDLHTFAYLACLLALFDGQPAAEWGYRFVCTRVGGPFSAAVSSAVNALETAGSLVVGGEEVTLTDPGEELFQRWKNLATMRERSPYLEAACDAALVMPTPIIAEGVRSEPGLRAAVGLKSSRELLDSLGVAGLHEHFKELRSVLGSTGELFTPATLWLTYLAQEAGIWDALQESNLSDRDRAL